MDEFKNETLR